ncbi:hypothetical protein HPP92_001457 [Vanilla planifolia]|uniref:Chromosome transmission fidelity protein 18 homolog n=1 Tax=Vanilla planifolia TaxID=51239 RepID=A0A835VHK4_VANPL|nr:hypothetical protein HPP92_001457 [Vanilla planifolia]
MALAFEEEAKLPSHPTITEQLWVEKYAPSSFSELLSDDQTNREAANRYTCRLHLQITDPSKLYSILYLYKSKMSKSMTFESCRCFYFVVLLGFGKTTLAHVAAKHCGYRVVEINASDDRSSAAIESKILDAVQMNSVVADSKPKCLVIDEIDGSLGEGKGAVEVILKMVAADKKNSTERANSTEQASSGNSSKKGPKPASLLRPVICICNDLYAPALRPIRQIAKVHIFMQPSISRVVNRLKHICKKEGYKTNSIALATLAEYTECDIRSCLNTLQFLNKKKETLNILEVGSQIVGRKDISRSYFDIWKVIFHKRKDKHVKRPKNDASGHGNFDFMYSVLSNRGDHDLAVDGIHENFLGVSYHDPLMLKTVKCLDMVGVADRMHKYIMRNQQMALHAYQPLLAIIISRFIAQVEKPNIEWPKSLQRCRNLFMEKMELFKLWQSRIPPNMSRHLSTEYFSEDFVSHFLHILAPLTLRPVSLHLFSEREKDDLAQLVDTMVTYSLTYKNSRDENLQVPDKPGSTFDVPVLSLEPRLMTSLTSRIISLNI